MPEPYPIGYPTLRQGRVGLQYSNVSSLDDDFSRMQFEPSSSEEQVTNDGDYYMDSQVWDEIASEPNIEFWEDYGMMEEVPANSEEYDQSYRLLPTFHH